MKPHIVLIAKLISVTVLLLFYSGISARTRDMHRKITDTTVEPKVDYIEQIYFSGKNKDDMYKMLLTTVQSLDGKPATYIVAKQYIFLVGVEDAVKNADDACEAEQILAQGIYNLDVTEATKYNIPIPDDKSKANIGAALQSLSDFGNSTQNLAYNAWVLNRNHVDRWGYYYDYGYTPSEAKIAQTGYQISAVANTVGTGVQMADETKKALKYLGLNKDKPCKRVAARDIAIGSHIAPDTSSTTIVLQNITYQQVASIAEAIAHVNGVNSINNDKFDNNVATMFIVAPNIKIQDLISKIGHANSSMKFDVVHRSTNGATLALK